MSYFKCPHCSFDPGAHAWSGVARARHKWEAHQIPSRATFNSETNYYPDKETWENRGSMLYPMFKLHSDEEMQAVQEGLTQKEWFRDLNE